jgi:hypothetical protein
LALEALDQLLPRALRDVLFALIEELPHAERHQRLESVFPQQVLTLPERLRLLLQENWLSPWTRSCLLFEIGLRGYTELGEVACRDQDHADRVVRETAAWACTHLGGDRREVTPCS